MLPRTGLRRIQVAFDDHRLFDPHLDLGRAPGRANGGTRS